MIWVGGVMCLGGVPSEATIKNSLSKLHVGIDRQSYEVVTILIGQVFKYGSDKH